MDGPLTLTPAMVSIHDNSAQPVGILQSLSPGSVVYFETLPETVSLLVHEMLPVSNVLVLTCARNMETSGLLVKLISYDANGQQVAEVHSSFTASIPVGTILQHGVESVHEWLFHKSCLNEDDQPSGFVVPVPPSNFFMPGMTIGISITHDDTLLPSNEVSNSIHTTLEQRQNDRGIL